MSGDDATFTSWNSSSLVSMRISPAPAVSGAEVADVVMVLWLRYDLMCRLSVFKCCTIAVRIPNSETATFEKYKIANSDS